jgi:hypothetical protein
MPAALPATLSPARPGVTRLRLPRAPDMASRASAPGRATPRCAALSRLLAAEAVGKADRRREGRRTGQRHITRFGSAGSCHAWERLLFVVPCATSLGKGAVAGKPSTAGAGTAAAAAAVGAASGRRPCSWPRTSCSFSKLFSAEAMPGHRGKRRERAGARTQKEALNKKWKAGNAPDAGGLTWGSPPTGGGKALPLAGSATGGPASRLRPVVLVLAGELAEGPWPAPAVVGPIPHQAPDRLGRRGMARRPLPALIWNKVVHASLGR